MKLIDNRVFEKDIDESHDYLFTIKKLTEKGMKEVTAHF